MRGRAESPNLVDIDFALYHTDTASAHASRREIVVCRDSHMTTTYGPEVLGRRVWLQWQAGRKLRWYGGTITHFDEPTGEHTIAYEVDGENVATALGEQEASGLLSWEQPPAEPHKKSAKRGEPKKPTAVADEATDGLCEYERQRLANIAANNAKLQEIGLQSAGQSILGTKQENKQARKRPRERATPVQPVRGSRRLAGEAAEVSQLEADALDLDMLDKQAEHGHGLKRASNNARITREQSDRLNALEEASATETLTDDELRALDDAIAYVHDSETSKGWQAHRNKGTSMWKEKRELLREASEMFGIRWPTWLAEIEAVIPMGSTPAAKDQTMFCIEKAACGWGLGYRHWPDGVGVLLSTKELKEGEAPPRPRVLTLGSDTETLRREGQKLEAQFGHDAGNGWVYNHALNKLYKYQQHLLRKHFDDAPSAPSVRDLEERDEEEAVDAVEAVDSADVPIEAPFTKADVKGVVELAGEDVRDVREMLEQQLGMDMGELAQHEAVIAQMISAA